jgi:hypothetical protein
MDGGAGQPAGACMKAFAQFVFAAWAALANGVLLSILVAML